MNEQETLKDVLFQATMGMDKKTFLRKAQLMRGPEGWGENRYCPVCKKPIHTNEQGDMTCENFSLGYEKNGKCFWHRWKDGTNYWSDLMDVMKSMAKDNPEMEAILKEHGVK